MFGTRSGELIRLQKLRLVLNWSATLTSLFDLRDRSKSLLMSVPIVTRDSLTESLLAQIFSVRITAGNLDQTVSAPMCPPLAQMQRCRLLNSPHRSCKKSTTSFGFHHLNLSPTFWKFLNGTMSRLRMSGCHRLISKLVRPKPLITSSTSHTFHLFMPEHSVQIKICSSPITPPSAARTVGDLLSSTHTSLRITKTR